MGTNCWSVVPASAAAGRLRQLGFRHRPAFGPPAAEGVTGWRWGCHGGNMARDETLKIRLSPPELAAIKAHAVNDDTTVSALVRAGLAAVVNRKSLLTKKDAETLAALREEVRRVGVNLNALLRSVHLEEHGVSPSGPRLTDYQALQADLRAMLDKLTAATRALPL